MGLPVPATQLNIERVVGQKQRSNNPVKYLVKNTDFYDNESTNKIILTKTQLQKLDILFKQYDLGLLSSKDVLLELRGGDGMLDMIVIFAFVIWANWYNADAYVTPLPHQDPFGWMTGKYDRKQPQQCLVDPSSRFERETFTKLKQMSLASVDEDGYVMSKSEALKLITETYASSTVTEDCKLSGFQSVKKLVHGKGVGVDPKDYGMTQAELVKIGSEGGLVAYVRRGNKLPSVEHVKAFQKAVKDICLDPSTTRRDDSEYYDKNGVTPATVFKNGRYIISFNQTSGDFITGDKQKDKAVQKYKETNKLGGQNWIEKWSKN